MVWAGDAYWRITDTLGMRGGLQYDRRLGSVLWVMRLWVSP